MATHAFGNRQSEIESLPDPFRFCPECGQRLARDGSGPEGRPWCRDCGYIRYRNPAVGVSVIVRDAEGRVLLGLRAKGFGMGKWCIPCGYVEWGEEVREAAAREFEEETGLEVEIGPVAAVHSNFHNPKQLTVGIWFHATVAGGTLHLKDGELDEIRYVDPAHPPALAFPTDALVLAELAGG